jgi:hypothetical protein
VAEERELQLHTTRSTRPLEWIGLTIVKAWLRVSSPRILIEDVHNNPAWFDKGIDLILKYPDHTETIDLKVDSYYGTQPSRKARGLYNLDSGVLLIETTSQLRYDRTDLQDSPDVPGWFFTSTADRILYYFVAILTPAPVLKAILARRRGLETVGEASEMIDRELLSILEIERDELLSYSLEAARTWFKDAPKDAFEGWAGAGNPGYVTVSKRLRRDYFLKSGWGTSHGPIFEIAKRAVEAQGPPRIS